MNIDTLKCFILVAENLSFARAAEALYISQPAVTKQISSLEAELGTALFIRSTRHVELTQAGMSFYKDAKDIVQRSQAAVNRIRLNSPAAQQLRIGLSNSTALNVLTPILTNFHREYPDIIPDIEVLTYKTILNLFMENKLDILFYYKENLTTSAGINFIELSRDPLVCIVPGGYHLCDKQNITVDDLSGEKIIACNPLNAPLSIAGIQQKLFKSNPSGTVIYCNTIETAHCLVAAGMGITVLPQTLCSKSSGVEIPLVGEKDLSFGCFYHKSNRNHSLKKFLNIVNNGNIIK